MTTHHLKYNPQIHVWYDDLSGNVNMEFNWEESCQGEYEEDEEGDEQQVGWTDACDHVENWLTEVLGATPALLHYPPQQVQAEPAYNPYAIKVALDPGQDQGLIAHKNEWGNFQPGVAPPKPKAFDTCVHFVPSEAEQANGKQLPQDHEWPFDKYLPYGTCTNKAVVGPAGIGVCQFENHKMPRCGGYTVGAAQILGKSTEGPTPVTLQVRRVLLGDPLYEIVTEKAEPVVETIQADTPAEAKTKAVHRFIELTGTEPVADPPKPKGTKFVASLVGCHAD